MLKESLEEMVKELNDRYNLKVSSFIGGQCPFQFDAENKELGISVYFRARGSNARLSVYDYEGEYDDDHYLILDDSRLLSFSNVCNWEYPYAGYVDINTAMYVFCYLWADVKDEIYEN